MGLGLELVGYSLNYTECDAMSRNLRYFCKIDNSGKLGDKIGFLNLIHLN